MNVIVWLEFELASFEAAVSYFNYNAKLFRNTGTFKELRTTSFIKSTGVACSDYVSHNRVQVLSIPVLLPACSQDWTCNLQMIVSLEALGTNAYNCYAQCTRWGNNNKDEGNSLKTLNDKNPYATSQKFRQLFRNTWKHLTLYQQMIFIK